MNVAVNHRYRATIFIGTGAFAAEQTWTGAISDKMCGTRSQEDGRQAVRSRLRAGVRQGRGASTFAREANRYEPPHEHSQQSRSWPVTHA
jgi:hypothetical protein